MTNVLYVCYENQFRSPYAAAYTRKVAPWLNVDSAGLDEDLGGPTLQAMLARDLGFDDVVARQLMAHQCKSFGKELASWADYIFVFEDSQADEIKRKYSEAAHKTCMLSEFATGKSIEINRDNSGDMHSANIQMEKLRAWIDILAVKLKSRNSAR